MGTEQINLVAMKLVQNEEIKNYQRSLILTEIDFTF